MPDLNSWLSSRLIDDTPIETKAVFTWRAILQHPTQIVINRRGTMLDEQTVRIEHNLRVREDIKTLTTTGVAICVVFGVRDHPTVPDTDIRARDRFVADGVTYEVVTLIVHQGEVQAVSEAKFG